MPDKPATTSSPSSSGTTTTNGREQDHDRELVAAFAEMLTALAARVPPGKSTPAEQPADSFADIWEAFARLRQDLHLPERTEPAPAPSAPPAKDSSAQASAALMDEAMTEARACAAWYRDTPEWQRINRVADAARALLTAIRDAARDYWTEFSRDARVRGFLRTVTIRTCRTIASCAEALARRLESDGGRGTRAWQAMSQLDRVATAHADHVTGHEPPVRDAEQTIAGRRRPHRQSAAPAKAPDSNPAALAALGFPASAAKVTTAAPPTAPRPPATRTVLRATAAKR